MPDPLTLAALACAAHLSGLPVISGYPPPYREARYPSAYERAHSNDPTAVGVYWPYAEGVLVAPSWPVLVHEAVHHLQRLNDLPFDEGTAYAVQRRANECLSR